MAEGAGKSTGRVGGRDDARTVLVAMVAELGPEYLPFAITVLRTALPAKGYIGHVLGFTLHAVLAALVQVRAAPAPQAGQHGGVGLGVRAHACISVVLL